MVCSFDKKTATFFKVTVWAGETKKPEGYPEIVRLKIGSMILRAAWRRLWAGFSIVYFMVPVL
jgi:hypothetical protein